MIFVISKRLLIRLVAIIIVVIIIIAAIYTKNPYNTAVNSNSGGYITLVIDDFGNNGEGTDAMMNLGIPITAAVMPFVPNSLSEATAAHKGGLEVILHVPLEAEHGRKEWLGPKAITTDLSDQQIQERINDALDEVQFAVGMNNHMGSKVTQDKRVMKNILEIAKKRNLLFLDSLTTENSIVSEVAEDLKVPYLKRDVFLDNSTQQKDIENQLIKLGDIAIDKGYAIGIGHVGPEGGTVTANAIKAVYPELIKKGIKFVTLSQIYDLFK